MLGFNYVVTCASKLCCWFWTPVSARSYRVSVFLLDWSSYCSVKQINSIIHSNHLRRYECRMSHCCLVWRRYLLRLKYNWWSDGRALEQSLSMREDGWTQETREFVYGWRRRFNNIQSSVWQWLPRLMPVTHVQINLHVCHCDLQQLAARFFSCKFLARNRTRSIWWCCTRNLHQKFDASFLYKKLVHVSCTSFLHVCHRHYCRHDIRHVWGSSLYSDDPPLQTASATSSNVL